MTLYLLVERVSFILKLFRIKIGVISLDRIIDSKLSQFPVVSQSWHAEGCRDNCFYALEKQKCLDQVLNNFLVSNSNERQFWCDCWQQTPMESDSDNTVQCGTARGWDQNSVRAGLINFLSCFAHRLPSEASDKVQENSGSYLSTFVEQNSRLLLDKSSCVSGPWMSNVIVNLMFAGECSRFGWYG